MKDTSFFVTDPEKIKRMAQPMPNDSDFRVGRINDPTVVKKWEKDGTIPDLESKYHIKHSKFAADAHQKASAASGN